MIDFMELIHRILPALLKGTVVTLELTACSISLGFVLGIALALVFSKLCRSMGAIRSKLKK